MLRWLEANEGSSIAVAMDEFWWIPDDSVYNLDRDPSELTIGSVQDCVDFLQSGVIDAEVPVSHGFVWLAQIFRAVGDQTSGGAPRRNRKH